MHKPKKRWVATHVPRAFHESVPAEVQPKLTLFKDAWFVVYLVLLIPLSVALGMELLFALPRSDEWVGTMILALCICCAELGLVSLAIKLLPISRGTPLRLVLMALAWGGVVAATLAGAVFSFPWLSVSEKLGLHALSMSLAAAVPEEVLKGLGVWILLWIGRAWWNRPWHGLVAGMLVGLGFGAVEHMTYALNLAVLHPESDVYGVIVFYGMRLILVPLLHMLMTGIVGYGIGKAMYEGPRLGHPARFLQLAGWGALAMSAHFAWNAQFPLEWSGATNLLFRVVLWLVLAGTVVWLIVANQRRLKPLQRAGLEPAVTVYSKVF